MVYYYSSLTITRIFTKSELWNCSATPNCSNTHRQNIRVCDYAVWIDFKWFYFVYHWTVKNVFLSKLEHVRETFSEENCFSMADSRVEFWDRVIVKRIYDVAMQLCSKEKIRPLVSDVSIRIKFSLNVIYHTTTK